MKIELLREIERLVEGRAPESPTLEFKAGDALRNGGKNPSEMIKDISGMANAAGGRIIYGISEDGPKNDRCASNFSPVMDENVSADWISQVVASRTSPPIPSLSVQSIPKGSGRIFVVDVAQGNTAHQSLFDNIYYQRIGAQVLAMQDFQVRDVMNRRMGPVLNIALQRRITNYPKEEARGYHFYPTIQNVGHITVSNWRLRVLVPQLAYFLREKDNAIVLGGDRLVTTDLSRTETGMCNVYTYSSGALSTLNKEDLHPGELLQLQGGVALPEINLKVSNKNYENLKASSAAIYWFFYSLNARPLLGSLTFDEWCDF
ncbi:helix-turn-helix domain-containing protein [Variovorax sp. CY25R-8]|uniref:AlbA family DNA-binding domain-containing protein n=1 Tax=Variovorax sp. CY25R-8 TaxID=2855501 RepID=UPI0021BB4E0D|nr:ATP-binding protein [Variovorax sp. CY25R-8]MCT8174403.1 ATP-binding protein [Variovorax sp. CY25R-8]